MTDLFLREKLETLDGSRAGKKTGAAVRRRDLAAIVLLRRPVSTRLDGSPTADDFNKLQADVAAIFEALKLVASKVKP